MALERDARSITDVARSLLDDVRDLFREEIALARAEFRQELGDAQSGGARLGAGVGLVAAGGVMLLFAIGRAVAAPPALLAPSVATRSLTRRMGQGASPSVTNCRGPGGALSPRAFA
jgi:hypothetical protein